MKSPRLLHGLTGLWVWRGECQAGRYRHNSEAIRPGKFLETEKDVEPNLRKLLHHRQRQIVPVAAFVVGLEGVIGDGND